MNQVSLAISFKKKLNAFSAQKQKEVMAVIAQLMIDDTVPSLKLHKTQRGDWWTAYVDGDIRVVLKREGGGIIYVAHVDHHEAAYQWADRNKLCQHPVTGTLQIVEIPQISARPIVNAPTQTSKKKVKPFVEVLKIKRDELFQWGIPEEWLEPITTATTQDEILEIALHLPTDVAEIAMAIGEGKRPIIDEETKPENRNLQTWHVVSSDDELTRMLNEAWDLWAVYLHPTQRAIAEKTYSGPARVGGSAGTGKTVVLLHHAKYLLRHENSKTVLITTFSDTLATDLSYRLGALLIPQERERCDTRAFYDFGHDCYKKFLHRQKAPQLLTKDEIRTLIFEILKTIELPKGLHPSFICSEWEKIVDVRNLMTWESYRDTKRRNVTIRLSVQKREAIWKVFEALYAKLNEHHAISHGMMFGELTQWYKANKHGRCYDYILVDEAQDLGEMELAFLVAYNQRLDGLFFAGDIGQRVCRYAFPWKQYGVDLRGKSKTLRINYRTTQEIRKFADNLVTLSQTDPDGEEHNRTQTISLLCGPKPELKEFNTKEDEIKAVTEWLNRLKHEKNVKPSNIAIFVRSENELERAFAAYHASEYNDDKNYRCKVTTMEEAKGMEYQAVVVMACDCDVLPSQERLSEKDIVASIEEIYDTERNLFYVACTRARDYLLVTCGNTPSEFLLDL